MLKLFSSNDRSAKSHIHSTTLPHVQQLATHPIPPVAVDNDGPVVTAPASLPNSNEEIDPNSHNTLTDIALTEPRKTHQRAFTEVFRSPHDLPPLMTPSPASSSQPTAMAGHMSPITSDTQIEGFRLSLEQSQQSPPTTVSLVSRARFTGDKGNQAKADDKGKKLACWFKGESEPINIGLIPSPTKERTVDPREAPSASSSVRPTSLLHQKSSTYANSKPAMASRFSFFASQASTKKPPSRPLDPNDEFLNLDPSAALRLTENADISSPKAFKDLQQHAEGLVSRLRTAYKERSIFLQEMIMEKETLVEEVEGANTRAEHLKMQLDDMAVKLDEQDKVMMNLVDELAQEKLARREEKEARKRTTTSHGRKSRATTVSDSGFESEDDSSVESVFSRNNGAQSPTMSMSSVSTTNSPETHQSPDFNTTSSTVSAARLRVSSVHTTIKSMPVADHSETMSDSQRWGCASCEGASAHDAWRIVGTLKQENQGLKQRVGELEGALDGCLDLVGRLS